MTSSIEQELKIQFPSVVRSKTKLSEFYGILRSSDNEPALVLFIAPNFPSAQGVSVQMSDDITKEFIEALISKSDSLNFLEFVKLTQNKLLTIPKKPKFNSLCISKFYYEFRQLRFEYSRDKFIFDEENETLKICHKDAFDVEKYILIKIDFYRFGLMYNVVTHNLLGYKNTKVFYPQATLTVIYKLFIELTKELAELHEVLTKIDATCWVIAPPDRNYDINYRTIVIGENNVSMKLTFEPLNMSKIPEFKFFGPSNLIEKYTINLSENLCSWDSNRDILQNILSVLDLPYLPIKPENPQKKCGNIILYDSNTECCICFCFHLNDETPDVVCENECCRRQFHNDCLYEWLSRLPNCQILFGSMSGECPNCEKMVYCKVPEIKN